MKISEATKKKYSDFISGIKLDRIYLSSIASKFNELLLKESGLQYVVKIDQKARYEKIEKHAYKIFQDWNIYVVHPTEKEKLLDISFEFIILLESQQSLTKGIFKIYSGRNLIFNTWPYARELINNITHRMGISPLTLPFLKSVP